MVSEAEESLRERCIFDAHPSFLIEKEQMDVIEEWGAEVLADLVVSTADDQKSLVAREESHLMTDSAAWRVTLLFDLLPFCRHNLPLNAVWLQIFEFRQELAFGILSTEIVNAVENSVRL